MPEFPLSKPDIVGSDPPPRERKRDSNSERRWRLYSISYYANLQPSQIVREMDAADRGWNADYETGHEHSPRAVRQDGTADADRQRENTPEPGQIGPRTVDERRYVIDPIVEGHTYEGLWTGGPVVHAVVQGHKVLRQTLTRTWCAGHGYTVNEDGAYVAVWPNGVPEGIGGVHGTSGNDDSDSDPEVREYRTAKECLKECRPWMDGRLSPYMAFRTDIPASFTREVYWREFTHESITPLESLTRDDLVEIVSYHFGEKVGPTVMDAHTRVDPQTNTVIFVCSLLYTDLAEPEGPEDLLELPCIDGPCERETLRMFGWNQLRNGEGYEYKHYYRWPRLKDTPATRKAIEFVCDNGELTRDVYIEEEDNSDSDSEPQSVKFASSGDPFLLALLARHRHNDKAPGWWADYEDDSDVSEVDQLDNTGRLKTKAFAASKVPVQHYRIADQKVDVEQDGSLTFTIIVAKAEWHGYDDGQNYEDGGQRQLASVSNPQGYEKSEHRVIPSVPRENAIDTMNDITAGSYEIISQKSQTEGQKGSSDISFQKQTTYDYISDPGNGHTPDDIINIDGTIFNAPQYSYDPDSNTYSLTYNLVEPSKVQDLVDRLRQLLGGEPKITVKNDGGGSYTVKVSGRSKEPKHIAEWVVEADWFQHQTMEQWIGVTVKRDGDGSDSSNSGDIVGFYTKYNKVTISGVTTYVADLSSFVRLDAVRGDLDADWMGSDPQAVGQGPRAPVLYYSIGVDDEKELRTDVGHDDEHGDGWSSSAWSDPDNEGDASDKARSHVISRAHPRINGDGTIDISITRIYPHQRKWEWEFDQMNKSGDIRTVYHAVYRNWPSRQKIKDDIVKRFLQDHNQAVLDAQSEDGYTLSGSISVNQFGLVDAPGLTLTPNWENSRNKKSRAKTYTAHLDQKVGTIEKTHTCPQSFRKQDGTFDPPADGFWWRVVNYYIYSGETTAKGEAWREYKRKKAFYEGSKGVEKANGKPDINALWKWHVVYNIDPGGWKDTTVDYSLAQTEVISSGEGVEPD